MFAAILATATGSAAAQQDGECEPGERARYTFSWMLDTGCALAPRGGTSTGTEVTLDPDPHPGWQSLQEEGLSDFEKDRRAILAMAGPYRTSFEFLEVVGYTPDFERAAPYQSWSTEYVYVVADEPEFISLQHIIVMFMKRDSGEVVGPIVQKHWRQDWEYEAQRVFEFTGNRTWQWRELEPAETEGKWVQSVYQVDDSPRYAAPGQWRHHGNVSTWVSDTTLRPLPRRESSVRDDYDALEGINSHTITPDGWVHEQENYKVILDEDGDKIDGRPYLAKELGMNRYDRIVDFDFSGGNEYWQATGEYWSVVREVWNEQFSSAGTVEVAATVDGVPSFAPLFEQAQRYAEEPASPTEMRETVREIIDPYVQ